MTTGGRSSSRACRLAGRPATKAVAVHESQHLGTTEVDGAAATQRLSAPHEDDLLVGPHVLKDLVRRDQPAPLLGAVLTLAGGFCAARQGLAPADALGVSSRHRDDTVLPA